jgi:hypothetical protein
LRLSPFSPRFTRSTVASHTRTDLTYHPDPDGHPVFINPTTIVFPENRVIRV